LARRNAAHCGGPKRRKQPKRYVQYFMPKFFVAPRRPWRGEFIL
jgi:hypothetical protein